jgi:hypothetical protein
MWHPKESVRSLMAGYSLLVRISCRKRNFPIAAITIQSTEETGITERIITLVHTMKRIHIRDGHRVQLPAIDAKPHRLICFGCQHDLTGPISAGRFDNTGFQHQGNFLTLHFPNTRSSAIRLRMYWCRSRIEIDSMFSTVNSI